MRIYFIRHGESEANRLREISNRGLRHGLTLKGRERAATLAQHLQDQAITRIYSSPLLRAIETSVILARRWGVEYEVTDALREYDCGLLEGRSDEAAWQQWQALFEAWTVHRRWEERLGQFALHEEETKHDRSHLARLDDSGQRGYLRGPAQGGDLCRDPGTAHPRLSRHPTAAPDGW